MTTHSFADEVLNGQYEIRVREYQEEKESLLATCRRTVRTHDTMIRVAPIQMCLGQ